MAHIEREKGPSGQEQDKLVLTGLEKIDEPDSLRLLRQRGMAILPEDVARLSPIGHEHVNVYGKYSFQLAESIQQGAFHPLRELDETESLEGDQEAEQPTETAEISFGA